MVVGVEPDPRPRREIAREFRALVANGAVLRPAGSARLDPSIFLERGYVPRAAIHLFHVTFFLTDPKFDDGLGFFVAYVVPRGDAPTRAVYPRLFYKDSSLVWRAASHFVHTAEEYWIGKGDTRWAWCGDGEALCSAEETTNLPFELQGALDAVRGTKRPRRDDDAVERVLREGPAGRLKPYAEFTAPRRRAEARYQINGGRPVARFTRRGDPTSLRFTRGFEPDFAAGVIERTLSDSKFYGGPLEKYRILSSNRRIQYYFIASPKHVWVNPPQSLTTELSSFGVRTIDVLVDDDLCVPGYEYHFVDEETDPPRLHSQIPPGFAGEPNPLDPSRADASAWLDALPVVQEFRAKVLARPPAPKTRTTRNVRPAR